MKRVKCEVGLVLLCSEGLGLVELPDGRVAIEEGEEARVRGEHVRVVGEGHFDGDAVHHQLEVVIGEFPPVLRRNGVTPKEAERGGAAQAAWAGIGPDGEVRCVFDDEV